MSEASPPPIPARGPAPLASPSRRRIGLTAAAIGAAAVTAVFFVYDPTQHDFYPRCWFHQSTGFHCPGCGGQRAIHALVTGDVARAFGHNFIFMAALPFVAWHFGRILWWRIKKVPPRLTQPLNPFMTTTLLIAVILFGVLRNLPIEPFSHLAP